MPTHDYVIDNQTAPNFRSDLNNALQAIVSQNSNATPPATTYANMLWYETDTNNLWKRNEANSAWISMGVFDESLGTFTPSGVSVNTASVLSATAGASWGAVGTYAFVRTLNTVAVSTTFADPGDNVAGSSLVAAGVYQVSAGDFFKSNTNGVALSGTWKIMGYMRNSESAISTTNPNTLALRIS
jgi:hypothetical protein